MDQWQWLLEGAACNENGMTEWRPYHEVVDYFAPDLPGVYEVCWGRDNGKQRYIGMSLNLRKRLYGHPYHPSKVGEFIGIHMNSRDCPPLIRFKVMSSPEAAEEEEKRRLRAFKSWYGELPMYNQNY